MDIDVKQCGAIGAGVAAGNRFVLPRGGFALLSLDSLDNGNSPTADGSTAGRRSLEKE